MSKNKNHTHTSKCTDAQHHLHMRKRMSLKKFELGLIDRLVFIAGPLIPIAIAPTAYTVWVKEEVAGISLITWGTLSFTSFVMASYALIHREKVLIITYIPLFLLNTLVVIGVLIKT